MEKLSGAEKTAVTRRHHRGRPGAAQDLMLGDHRGRPGAAQDLMLGDQPPPGLRPSYGQDVAGHQDQLVLLDGVEAR
jgi:hypothetical protein